MFMNIILVVVLFSTQVLAELPYCQPSRTEIIWLPPAAPPCFHPGQPVMTWPNRSTCRLPSIRSKCIQLDEDGLVLAKDRICFYFGYQTIDYEIVGDYEIGGLRNTGSSAEADGTGLKNGESFERSSSFRVGHPIYSTQTRQRRMKRWVRRRNPNSDAIHFQQERYIRELREDAAVDSLVVSVKATHAAGQAIYYSMVAPRDARSQNIFTLDTVSGDIRLAKSLDRETLDKHILKVTAYERLDPTVTSSTTVIIDVLDVQDNSPIFERDSYFADIREDAPIATTVLSVFARDLDAGANGELEYSLGDGAGKEYLTIHPKTGVIQTATLLDRETIDIFRLYVFATDKGEPPRKSSALVEITITDVNDNAPVFEQEHYNITLLENVTVPVVVANIRAKDKDKDGVNGQVHYSIVSAASVPVTIDYSTGDVTLRGKIDVRDSPLTLLVRAKDGAQPALSSTVPLTLNVVDINDHPPTIIASQKQIFVDENLPVGEEIGKVQAIDQDFGENGRVSYHLNVSDHFNINEQTGVIKTTKALDREEKDTYTLQVIVSDHGSPPLNSTTTITVIVKDVNDNAPTFDQKVHNVSLSEDTPRGEQIIILKAVDKDQEQKIVYRVEHADRDVVALIDLGDQGALLSLSDQLKNSDQHLRFEVSATDQGGLQGRCTVNVFVQDVNSAPSFLDPPFVVRIPEDSPPGFQVVQLKAVDPDRGDNAKLTYSIDSTVFNITNDTGVVTVAEPLDREEKGSYTVVVTVSDSAPQPLSTTTHLEIIIDDGNDNPPLFTSSNYTASIPEDIPVGTSFLQLSAVDLDIGQNGIIDYFLNTSESSETKDLFRLDRTSGTLRVNQKLDREQNPVIHLYVYAKDRGTPPLSSSSSITVILSDVNDNAPKFEQTSYDLYIAENSPAGSTVGTISASDPDEGENSVIEFRIFGGTDAKLFDIEADAEHPGVVRVLSRAEFDYEAKANNFFFELQATSGQLSSTVPVRIRVSDVNDNRPQLKDFIVLINRFGDEKLRREIGTIPAFDPDQNATLEFFLEENEVIKADKYTGKLALRHDWKRNIDASFKCCVSDGANTVCAAARVIHTFVSPEWLRESVLLSISKVSLDRFWDPAVFVRFRQALSTLDNWDEADVHVIGAQKVDDGIHVSVAVTHRDRVIRAWKIRERLRSDAVRLERLALLRIQPVVDETCAKEPCPYYQRCRQTLKYVNEEEFHETDNFLARTLKTVKTFVCECPAGFTSSIDLPGQCDLRLDQCFNNPCRNNGSCVPLEESYRCDCLTGFEGVNCEMPRRALTCRPGYCQSEAVCEMQTDRLTCKHCKYRPEDSDERCRLRSLSFDGKSMANINAQLSRIEWSLEFRLATIDHDGVVLFSGDKNSDFIELSIRERILTAEFSVGGTKSTVAMERERKNRVNDGEWHTVRLDYYERKLVLTLDDCDAFTSLHVRGHCAAQSKIDLPTKCLDPTVPCFRFLDVHNGIYLGAEPSNRKPKSGFSGCIANLTLDGSLVDFSNFDEMEMFGDVRPGCTARQDFCSIKSCAGNAKCENKWNGRNCRCQNTAHSDGACQEHLPAVARPISLTDEESYVLYQPSNVLAPFTMEIDVRTSRHDTQVLAIEFDKKASYYIFEIEDGSYRTHIGSQISTIKAPEFPKGHWMNVKVEFNEETVVTTVDGLYSVTNKVSFLDVELDVIYIGLAPSTSHPSRFEGCVRDLRINDVSQEVKERGKVRLGCIVQNRCNLEGICPKESSCVREWNRHSCKCHKGFVGDTCLPACGTKGICGSEGSCSVTNSSYGYDCQCSSGFRGANCDRVVSQQLCPLGWWGSFPKCRRCECSEEDGFQTQCDEVTGQCKCRKYHYPLNGHCVPCECGFGASSRECGQSGQCNCTGEAVGRRCDRCEKHNWVLDSKAIKCIPLRDRCPTQIEYGVQWPTTVKGAMARQSCPGIETGLATRSCGADGKWQEVNSYNCTRPEFSVMVNKFDVLNGFELLSMLHNATRTEDLVRGRNAEIARSAVERLIEGELRLSHTLRGHTSDTLFTLQLVESAAKILPQTTPSEFVSLMTLLTDYGNELLETHRRMPYLQPFEVARRNTVFAIDRLDKTNVIPKQNNFISKRFVEFPNVRATVHSDQVFYMILPYPRCVRCENPVVVVLANTSKPIVVDFPMDENSGWKYPDCVRLQGNTHPVWSSKQANLIGLNMTHASCEFQEGGIFTVLSKADQGIYLRMSHSSNFSSPVMALVSLLLCLTSIVATFVRRGIKTHLIRIGFILFFILNAAHIYLLDKTAISQVFCPVRNAVLSFTSCAPFAWLFLYALHLYRMLADGTTKSSASVCLVMGILLPCAFACSTFFFTSNCSIAPGQWLLWFIAIPIALFLILAFYASSTSFLISMNKTYDVFVMKFSVRKALLQHVILTLLTLLYTTSGLLFPVLPVPTPLAEILVNIVLVVTSLFILIWSICPSSTTLNDTGTLWLDAPQKSMMMESTTAPEPDCGSPLLPDPADHWMPDVIPSDPFLTSTPIKQTLPRGSRDIVCLGRDSRANSLTTTGCPEQVALIQRDNSLASTILSPAEKVLSEGFGHVYGNMGSLPRFRCERDDAEDAYYTYTRKKLNTNTFARPN